MGNIMSVIGIISLLIFLFILHKIHIKFTHSPKQFNSGQLGSELHGQLGSELHGELGSNHHGELGSKLRGELGSELHGELGSIPFQ